MAVKLLRSAGVPNFVHQIPAPLVLVIPEVIAVLGCAGIMGALPPISVAVPSPGKMRKMKEMICRFP